MHQSPDTLVHKYCIFRLYYHILMARCGVFIGCFVLLSAYALAEVQPALEIEFQGQCADLIESGLDKSEFSDLISSGNAKIKVFKKGAPSGTAQKLEVAKLPSFADRSFLRLTFGPSSGPSGIIVSPFGFEYSLAALSGTNNDGKLSLQGALDVFFRLSEGGISVPFVLLDRGPDEPDGLRLTIDRRPEGMRCTLRAESHCFGPSGEGQPDSAQMQTSLARNLPVDIGQIYHFAITFETSEQRVLTVKLFRAAGNIALDTTSDAHLEGSFQCSLKDSLDRGFSEGNFVFGSLSTFPAKEGQIVIDIAGVRIFPRAPKIFSPL